MSTLEVAKQITDAFNRHGEFTALLREHPDTGPEIVVRHLDTGATAATVWPPFNIGRERMWMWLGGQPGMGPRFRDESATIEEVVRAVATFVLDEDEVKR